MRKILTAAAAALMLCSCSLPENDDSSDTYEESSIGGYEIPAVFSEEDLEVQSTLQNAMLPITDLFEAFSDYTDIKPPPEYKVIFEQPGDKDGEHVENVYKVMYSSSYFNSLARFKEGLEDYLTDEALGLFEKNFAVGEDIDKKSRDYWYNERTDQESDTIRITVTEGDMLGEDGSLTAFPHIITLENITLVNTEASDTVKALKNCFWTTAHITEKTDSEIKFAYIIDTDGILTERTGILKNEDGRKLSWYMDWLE